MSDIPRQSRERSAPRRRGTRRMRLAMSIGLLAGAALLVALIAYNSLPEIAHILATAGWALLLVIPARLISVALDAIGWKVLLPKVPSLTAIWLTWAATVREAINSLLPVARVGGEVAGVRLLMMRGVSGASATASVIVELSLTMVVQFAFTLLGLALLLYYLRDQAGVRIVIIGLLVSLPLMVVFILLQRRWGLFQLLERSLAAVTGRKVLSLAGDPALLDQTIQGLYRQHKRIIIASLWQFTGLVSGAAELWFTLWLLDRPIDPLAAIMLESLTQAAQSASFLVPGSIGIQEGSFVLFGSAAGLTPEVALAVSLARRVRQIGLGLPALLSWQWVEGLQLRRLLKRNRSTGA